MDAWQTRRAAERLLKRDHGQDCPFGTVSPAFLADGDRSPFPRALPGDPVIAVFSLSRRPPPTRQSPRREAHGRKAKTQQDKACRLGDGKGRPEQDRAVVSGLSIETHAPRIEEEERIPHGQDIDQD